MAISESTKKFLLTMQKNEVTEGEIYSRIARRTKDEKNRDILLRIAQEELTHAAIWHSYTGTQVRPNKLKIWFYVFLSVVFGFTFSVKLMEGGEEGAVEKYHNIADEVPEAEQVYQEEQRHEEELLDMLDEERLRYVGSMVLGLNDALVELTGTLAGLTFAMQNNRLVALSGLITGISATFSMASSEFLSARSEGRSDALKSCTYTGIAYVVTVALLVLPYLLLPDSAYLFSLFIMLGIVVAIILVFNFYISVAQGYSFRKRFGEMLCISLGVAALSFVVGLLVKHFLGIDV